MSAPVAARRTVQMRRALGLPRVFGPYDVDVLAATIYRSRAQSPQPVPDHAEWERLCGLFPGSTRGCYEEVQRMIEMGDLDD